MREKIESKIMNSEGIKEVCKKISGKENISGLAYGDIRIFVIIEAF